MLGGQLGPEEKGEHERGRDGSRVLKDCSDLYVIVNSFLDVLCCNFSS